MYQTEAGAAMFDAVPRYPAVAGPL
jgi:hypothetical protein